MDVLLVDRYAGVRTAIGGLLAARGIVVAAGASSVAEAVDLPGEVVVAGLVLPDGTAADLAGTRPVVAYTWLPADERPPVAADGLAALVEAGALRAELADAVLAAAGHQGADALGSVPGRDRTGGRQR